MQLPSRVASFFDQRRFDTHVDVFELDFPAGPGVALLVDLGFDLVEAALDLFEVVGGDELDVFEHPGVGDGALDVVGVEPFVVVQRRDKPRGQRVGGGALAGLGVFPGFGGGG